MPARARPQAATLQHHEPLEGIRAHRRERKRDCRRDDDADDDRPEQAFVGGQRRALRAVGDWQPEDDRAGQIGDRDQMTRCVFSIAA